MVETTGALGSVRCVQSDCTEHAEGAPESVETVEPLEGFSGFLAFLAGFREGGIAGRLNDIRGVQGWDAMRGGAEDMRLMGCVDWWGMWDLHTLTGRPRAKMSRSSEVLEFSRGKDSGVLRGSGFRTLEFFRG